jgi:hypothetical protein
MKISEQDEIQEQELTKLPKYPLIFEECEMESILELIARLSLSNTQAAYIRSYITHRMLASDRLDRILPDWSANFPLKIG